MCNILKYFRIEIVEVPLPDTYGTQQRQVGCYVPILTRCPPMPLHRSKRGSEILAQNNLK